MTNRSVLALSLLVACGGHPSTPTKATTVAGSCPPAVLAAVTKAYPDAKQDACKGEHEDGKDVFEIKIAKGDGSRAEVQLAADGTILETEEVVAAMPDAVAKAFAAKYPGATATRIERVTPTGKPSAFEIKFAGKEATFTEAGGFVEEEGGGGDPEDGDKD